MNHTFLRLAPALALCLPLLAAAQQPAKTGALRYESAYADYKAYRDLEPGDWRALNGTVGTAALKGGGHAGHGVAPAAAAPAAPASAPQPMHHQHHHHKEGPKK